MITVSLPIRRQYFYTPITILVFGFLYAYTAVSVLIGTSFALLRMRGSLHIVTGFWARSTFWVLGKRVRVIGRENLVKGGRYILVANHSSLFDIMAIMAFYPGVSWFGREYLLKIPLFGYFLRANGYIPMKQTTVSNTRGMLERLVQNSSGTTIAIFPEGTRTLTGKLNRFHRGFIHVLRASDLDILPVPLNVLYSLKPKNRFYIDFRSKIHVIIHKPIKNEELKRKNDEEIISRVKEVIESSCLS